MSRISTILNRLIHPALIGLCLCTLLVSCKEKEPAPQAVIRVTNTLDTSLKTAIAGVAIELPQGEFVEPEVIGPKPISNYQTKVMSRYEDGSCRWLNLVLSTKLGAKETKSIGLRFAEAEDDGRADEPSWPESDWWREYLVDETVSVEGRQVTTIGKDWSGTVTENGNLRAQAIARCQVDDVEFYNHIVLKRDGTGVALIQPGFDMRTEGFPYNATCLISEWAMTPRDEGNVVRMRRPADWQGWVLEAQESGIRIGQAGFQAEIYRGSGKSIGLICGPEEAVAKSVERVAGSVVAEWASDPCRITDASGVSPDLMKSLNDAARHVSVDCRLKPDQYNADGIDKEPRPMKSGFFRKGAINMWGDPPNRDWRCGDLPWYFIQWSRRSGDPSMRDVAIDYAWYLTDMGVMNSPETQWDGRVRYYTNHAGNASVYQRMRGLLMAYYWTNNPVFEEYARKMGEACLRAITEFGTVNELRHGNTLSRTPYIAPGLYMAYETWGEDRFKEGAYQLIKFIDAHRRPGEQFPWTLNIDIRSGRWFSVERYKAQFPYPLDNYYAYLFMGDYFLTKEHAGGEVGLDDLQLREDIRKAVPILGKDAEDPRYALLFALLGDDGSARTVISNWQAEVADPSRIHAQFEMWGLEAIPLACEKLVALERGHDDSVSQEEGQR